MTKSATARRSSSAATIAPNVVALLSGLLFGLGLGVSQMIDRDRVLGFLDIAGAWDPTLLFVLGGAVTVTVIAFRFVLQMQRPVFADRFRLPTKTDLDLPLTIGAAIFGIGWGIAGYCPGPAVAALTLRTGNPRLFLIGLAIGSITYAVVSRNLAARAQTSQQPSRN